MQFNLFAEDPLAPSVAASPLPWVTFFDRQRDLQVPLSPNANQTTVNGEEDGEVYEDSLILWKNEEWATNEVQKGKKDERSPWAGKNPLVACRIGQKALTGVSDFWLSGGRGIEGVTGLAYSPDGRFMAVVSDDGMLRLVDVQEERYVSFPHHRSTADHI